MNARLDQILLRLGYATEEQIQQALRRQRTHGGRLGSHLLYFKTLTEAQLSEALSIQHEMPFFDPSKHEVSVEFARTFPVSLAREHQAVPISCDMVADSVCVVVADPEDTHPIAAVRKALGFSNVTRYVAPEAVVHGLIDRVYQAAGAQPEQMNVIELPELFGSDRADSDDRGGAEPGGAAGKDHSHVLLVSRAAFLRNFLTPIFEREGYTLHVIWDKTDLELALKTVPFEHVLVAEEAESEFNKWIRQSGEGLPPVETSGFTAVSDALLQNTVPYPKVMRSLFRSLQIVAETRSSEANAMSPPYDLVCRDIEHLGRCAGLRRLAVDGLQIASLLLVPRFRARPQAPKSESPRVSFVGLDRSIDDARSLRFPWDVAAVFQPFLDLVSGAKTVDVLAATDAELRRAAQILALVWYRHTCIEPRADAHEDFVARVKTRLRELAGRMADSETVECYIRIVAQAGEKFDSSRRQQLFVVGHYDGVADQFATRLRHAGFHPVRIDDLGEARSMCARVFPSAILVHDESYPAEVLECRKTLKLDAPPLLYAITQTSDPSRILTLFDAGFDDVFAPPFDFEIIAARIGKSIRGATDADSMSLRPGGFRRPSRRSPLSTSFRRSVRAASRSESRSRTTAANGPASSCARAGSSTPSAGSSPGSR